MDIAYIVHVYSVASQVIDALLSQYPGLSVEIETIRDVVAGVLAIAFNGVGNATPPNATFSTECLRPVHAAD